MYSGVMPLKRYTTRNHIKNVINYPSKMKKNYEKPCCLSMVVAVEQAMLAGSGVTLNNQNFTTETHQVWGASTTGAKKDSFQQEDEQ